MYRLFKCGYPTCHAHCAKRYWVVLWDVGDRFETRYRLGLN